MINCCIAILNHLNLKRLREDLKRRKILVLKSHNAVLDVMVMKLAKLEIRPERFLSKKLWKKK